MEAKRDQVVCNPIKVKWKLTMLTHTADGLSVTHDVGNSKKNQVKQLYRSW